MCDREAIRAEAFREAAALIQKRAGTEHRMASWNTPERKWGSDNEAARLDSYAHEIRMLAGAKNRPSYVVRK